MRSSHLLLLLAMLLSAPRVRAQGSGPGPLRLGIVGLTHSHVHGLLGRQGRSDVVIVGIAEPDEALARRYVERYGLSKDIVFSSTEEMLERTKPTAVAVFGSTYEHLAAVQAAAPRGIHVMVEKPLAVSLEHARLMKALADRHRIVLMVNYETTWYPTLYRAAESLGRGEIGPLRKVVVRDGHRGPARINGVDPEFLDWLTNPARNGGGSLMDFGCYGANLVTYLMKGKRPTSVTAITQQLQPGDYPRVEDEATIVVTYPEMHAIIQASWNWPIGRKDMELYGTRGYVMTDNRSVLRTRTSESSPERTDTLPERDSPGDDPFSYLKALIEGRVTAGDYDPSSLVNNMLVMEILDAARRSAREGRTIRL